MHGKRFTELDPASFTGHTVILDVDGTLVIDGAEQMDAATEAVLRAFAIEARVYLCSNARSSGRLREFAHLTGAQFLDTRWKKPDVRVIGAIPLEERHDMIVIGDKFLTDGLLAARLGVTFVRVERLCALRERLNIRLTYAFDAIIGRAVCSMARMIPL